MSSRKTISPDPSRFRPPGSSFGFDGGVATNSPPPPIAPTFTETEEQTRVPRAALWAAVAAARTVHRRATGGRLNSDRWEQALADLEHTLAAL